MSEPTLTPKSVLSSVVLPSVGTQADVNATLPYKVYSDPASDLYDVNFLVGAAEQVSYVYKKLGGDILDIELTTGNVYSAYEEATLEYSYTINLHQATNTLARSLGNPTGSFDSKGNMIDETLSGSLGSDSDKTAAARGTTLKSPKFSYDFTRRVGMGASAEVGTMGSIEYSGSFDISVGQQDYDLQTIFESVTNTSATGSITVATVPANDTTFTVTDVSGRPQLFTFKAADNVVANGNIGINGDDTAAKVATRIKSAFDNMTSLGITATVSDTKVTLTQDTGGTAGNNDISQSSNHLTLVNFAGGKDDFPYAGKLKGKKIIVKHVFYKTPHAMWRFYGYYGGLNVVGNLHNYGQFTDDATFQLIPTWENKAQAMAFEDSIYTRMSHFSYEIKNNSQLRIYPIPQNFSPSKMWVRFSIIDDVSDSDPINDGVNNMNTLPFGNIPFANINSIGKQWIRRYALSLCKETLGQVRSKFGSVPIPGNDLKLNGSELITQAKEELKSLKTELQETLKELTYGKLAESDANLVENVGKALDKIPNMGGIYVG